MGRLATEWGPMASGPMARKHTQGLLLEEQEDSVEQFEIFGQVVQLRGAGLVGLDGLLNCAIPGIPRSGVGTYVVDDDQGLRPASVLIADGVEDALADHRGQQLLNEEGQEDAADDGQVEVVDQEERLELEGLAVAHELAATEDDGVVDDDEDTRLLERRHGRDALVEVKV